MLKYLFHIALIITTISEMAHLQPPNTILINGKVINTEGAPISDANVYIIETLEGDVTGEDGVFSMAITRRENITLKVTHIGYEDFEEQLILSSQKSHLTIDNIILKEKLLEGEAVTVTASSFSMADAEGTILKKMDVVTTAGAAADIMRALQTLPGVSQIDEGVGMYVRGGDESETVVLLDNSILAHPYKYESDTGGFFGMISPFLLSGTFFSTGGFSAKYGNALSGILAMETLDTPDIMSLQFGLGLAAVSTEGAIPFNNNKFSIRFSGNYSDTKLMFKLNKPKQDINQFPKSTDGNVSIIYRYSHYGQVKLFQFYNYDFINMAYETPASIFELQNKTRNSFTNLTWRHLFSYGLQVKSSLSSSANQITTKLGILDFRSVENYLQLRTDMEFQVNPKLKILGGFSISNMRTNITGKFPDDYNDLSSNSDAYDISADFTSKNNGIYLESNLNITKRLFTVFSLRSDYTDLSREHTTDPRFSVNYRITQNQSIRISTGIYHQSPDAIYLNPDRGNPNLLTQRATHYIFGYEIKSVLTHFRAEVYQKDYENLLLTDEKTNYSNGGYGYASGCDLFLKSNISFLSGWLSYSYLSAKRKTFLYNSLVPTDYEIKHNFSTSIKTKLMDRNILSMTYRIHSGRPYTAKYGEWNAGRLKSVQRLDLSWSYYLPFRQNSIVYYLGISNVFDRQNVYGYNYSPDYSERTEIKSTFGRNIYFGVQVIFNK